MTDMQVWEIAWTNIQSDYAAGRITRAQFVKEREYMWAAKRQIQLAQNIRCD